MAGNNPDHHCWRPVLLCVSVSEGLELSLSTVTAVYDRGSTVADAVRSLGPQTWTDREHVIQDGGSTDGTFEILAEHTNDRTC